MTTPITPQEARDNRKTVIHPKMIESFNELITRNLRNGNAKIEVDQVIDLFLEKVGSQNTSITRQVIFTNHWLDVEDLFRTSGWEVHYNKPMRDEIFKPYFLFKALL